MPSPGWQVQRDDVTGGVAAEGDLAGRLGLEQQQRHAAEHAALEALLERVQADLHARVLPQQHVVLEVDRHLAVERHVQDGHELALEPVAAGPGPCPAGSGWAGSLVRRASLSPFVCQCARAGWRPVSRGTRTASGAMIGVLTDDPRKARVHAEAIGSAALSERRAEAVSAHAELLAAQMRELRGLDRPEHQAPLRLATLVLMGGLSEAILGWLDGSLEMTRETLIEECARLAVAVADAVQATTARGAG